MCVRCICAAVNHSKCMSVCQFWPRFSLRGIPAAQAAPKTLKVVGRVLARSHPSRAFALDQSAASCAYRLNRQRDVELHVGPPGGKTKTTNLAEFSGAPEKLLSLAGYWFVVSNEGARKPPSSIKGRNQRQIGPFDDGGLTMRHHFSSPIARFGPRWHPIHRANLSGLMAASWRCAPWR